MSTNIAELGNEGKDHVVLLVDWSLADFVSELIFSEVLHGGRVEHLFGDFWELGYQEENSNGDTSTGDGKVDELDIDEIVSVLASEEELGGDERTDEGGNTVP